MCEGVSATEMPASRRVPSTLASAVPFGLDIPSGYDRSGMPHAIVGSFDLTNHPTLIYDYLHKKWLNKSIFIHGGAVRPAINAANEAWFVYIFLNKFSGFFLGSTTNFSDTLI